MDSLSRGTLDLPRGSHPGEALLYLTMDPLGISFVDLDVKKAIKEDKKQRKAEKKRLKKVSSDQEMYYVAENQTRYVTLS